MKKNSIVICLLKNFFAFKRHIKAGSGVRKVAERHSNEEESSSHPPSKSTRRMGICSMIEEEDRHHGMALSELRSQLILRHTLEKVGLL